MEKVNPGKYVNVCPFTGKVFMKAAELLLVFIFTAFFCRRKKI